MADYTQIGLEEAKKISQEFGVEIKEVVPLKGGMANSSFTVIDLHEQRWVLSILDNHDVASATNFIEITQHVAKGGVPTTEFTETKSGGLTAEWNENPCALKKYIDGTVMDRLPEVDVGAIGSVLKSIHNLPVPPIAPEKTRRLPVTLIAEHQKSLPEDLKHYIIQAEEFLVELELDSVDPRLIHGDLFLDNLVQKQDETIVVLDWETASIDAPILDIGVAITALATATNVNLELDTMVEELFQGYVGIGGESPFSLGSVWKAAAYASTLLSFHRFYRHCIRYPSEERKDIYKDILGMFDSFV